MLNLKKIVISFIAICLLGFSCKTIDKAAPAPTRFASEMETIAKIPFEKNKNRIVFTGSSSIRFWKDIQAYYPDYQIINTGFGGSQMSDLSHYLEEAVLRFAPSKVFIYEGDNDIAAERPLPIIMKHTKDVTQRIEKQFPNCQLIFISAKPSIARWHLKEQYHKVNQALKTYADKKNNRHFANVWDIMLEKDGGVIKAIFIEDGLHMNKKGYDLWDQIIRPYVQMD